MPGEAGDVALAQNRIASLLEGIRPAMFIFSKHDEHKFMNSK